MKCPKCNATLRKVSVSVHGAKNKALSYQCSKCDYFEFESKSSKKVVEELRETPCDEPFDISIIEMIIAFFVSIHGMLILCSSAAVIGLFNILLYIVKLY